jgi:hypothetical protein
LIGLSGSQVGIIYTLWHELNPASVVVVGTGGPIMFPGYQTLPGYYSVYAENPTTHCSNWMYDCAIIWPIAPDQVSAAISASVNPVSAGSAVTLTVNPTNGGSAPVYQWKVNGLNAGTNSATFTYVPLNDDEVVCVVISNGTCVSNNPAVSNTVIMQVDGVSPAVTVAGILDAGKTRCYNATQTLTVAGNGLTFIVQNGASATMVAGHNIRYLPGTTVKPGGYMHGYISTNNQYCGQQAPALPAVISGTEGEEPSMIVQKPSFSLYPNPTSGNFTIEQKGEKLYDNVKVEVYGMRGEKMMTGELIGEQKHQFGLNDLPHGIYIVKVYADGYLETFKLVKTR